MTFKSESWKSTGDNTYAVTGVLTMKNVAKEVVLKVKSLGFRSGHEGCGNFRLGSHRLRSTGAILTSRRIKVPLATTWMF